MKLFDIRKMETPGWFWTKRTYFLGAGGWFYADWRHPIYTLRWWIDKAIMTPKRRGWRWD